METKREVVGIFDDETEAELAGGRLTNAGIPNYIVKDDAGGMFPNLQQTEGVLLVVDVEYALRSRQILQEQ
ncbi:hypothetical protein JW992_08305 [candidate division KSB1 bacterium]|nr:hypothetical protein [candidate division KSB1 bacterium]